MDDVVEFMELVIVSDIQASESTLDMLALIGRFSSGLALGFNTPEIDKMLHVELKQWPLSSSHNEH